MGTLIHLKKHGDGYLHLQHAIFSLVAGFVSAVLVVLVLASSARYATDLAADVPLNRRLQV